MKKYIFSLVIASGLAFASEYKMEPAGAPPAEVPAAVSAVLQKEGYKVVESGGSTFAEIWFRQTAPSGPKSPEMGVVFPTIPHGSLLGIIRFPEEGADRRGQIIKPGIYTLRYSLYPQNGDHLGVAPQRDFLVLVPLEIDKDPNTTPKFDELMAMSRKASGTPHPAVLSMQTPLSEAKIPSLTQEGESDWAINAKIGDVPVSVIVVGKAEA